MARRQKFDVRERVAVALHRVGWWTDRSCRSFPIMSRRFRSNRFHSSACQSSPVPSLPSSPVHSPTAVPFPSSSLPVPSVLYSAVLAPLHSLPVRSGAAAPVPSCPLRIRSLLRSRPLLPFRSRPRSPPVPSVPVLPLQSTPVRSDPIPSASLPLRREDLLNRREHVFQVSEAFVFALERRKLFQSLVKHRLRQVR